MWASGVSITPSCGTLLKTHTHRPDPIVEPVILEVRAPQSAHAPGNSKAGSSLRTGLYYTDIHSFPGKNLPAGYLCTLFSGHFLLIGRMRLGDALFIWPLGTGGTQGSEPRSVWVAKTLRPLQFLQAPLVPSCAQISQLAPLLTPHYKLSWDRLLQQLLKILTPLRLRNSLVSDDTRTRSFRTKLLVELRTGLETSRAPPGVLRVTHQQ